MPNKLQLTGCHFGMVIVLSEGGRDKHGAILWNCECNCGNASIIRGSSLTSGRVKSCGCGVLIAASAPKTHGESHLPLYRRWQSMLSRCQNPNNSEYRNYGGRGISITERWQSYEGFAADMKQGFDATLELDRIDVNGNYGPENCRWTTRKEQQRNKRSNHLITWNDKTLPAIEWALLLGIKPNTLIYRLRRGWPIGKALEIANADP